VFVPDVSLSFCCDDSSSKGFKDCHLNLVSYDKRNRSDLYGQESLGTAMVSGGLAAEWQRHITLI